MSGLKRWLLFMWLPVAMVCLIVGNGLFIVWAIGNCSKAQVAQLSYLAGLAGGILVPWLVHIEERCLRLRKGGRDAADN